MGTKAKKSHYILAFRDTDHAMGQHVMDVLNAAWALEGVKFTLVPVDNRIHLHADDPQEGNALSYKDTDSIRWQACVLCDSYRRLVTNRTEEKVTNPV